MSNSNESLHTPAGLMALAKKISLGEGQKTDLREIVATVPYGHVDSRITDESLIWYPNDYRVPTRTEAPEGWKLVYELQIVSPNTRFWIYSGNNNRDFSRRSSHGSRPVVLANMAVYETPDKTGKVRFVGPWGETVETDIDTQELQQAPHIPDPKVRKESIGVTDARREFFDFFRDNMPTIDTAISHITANKPLSSLPLVLAK